MSKFRRIGRVMTGVLMLLGCLLIMFEPDAGYLIVAIIIAVTFVVTGIGTLIYYLTMGRYMVGGRWILFQGVIIFDLGIFMLSLTDIPPMYILFYLSGMHLFAGAISALRAVEAKKNMSPAWKAKLASGLTDIVIAALCMIFINSTDVAAYIYAVGLALSAISRIASAMRPAAIVYIQ